MTEVTRIAGPQPLPFSQLLAHILEEHAHDRLSLSELSARLRDRAWGGLLLIFAAINLLPLPPGATTITGLPLLAITAQLALGRHRPWFPRKLDERGIGANHLRRIAEKIAPWEARIERVLKPRLCALTNHRAARVIGAAGFLLSVILWLPIPLGNHAPALALTLFALALIYRDGVLAILGTVATVASVALVSLTFAAAWWAVVQLWQQIS
ncbi:MAG: exopolysaccharide biosynthesis protein [Sphingomicrobium sp.]